MKHRYPVAKIRLLAGLLLLGKILVSSSPALAQFTITAVSPIPNTRTVVRTSPVTVDFSQALLAGSVGALKVFSAQRGGLRSRGTTPAFVSGVTLGFNPLAYPFAPGETVFSTVTTAAASAGGALARPQVSQFTAATGGTGTGNFLPHPFTPYVAVDVNPQSLAVADLDGDGDQDLMVGNIGTTTQTSFTISVRFNDGTGSYLPGYELSTPDRATSIAPGDVDGDGDLDIVVTNSGAGVISVYNNPGTGVFPAPTLLAGAGTPAHATLGDVDGDGDLDIVTADYLGNHTLLLYANSGAGTFSRLTANPPLNLGQNPRRLVLGDVDSDGDLDLIVANDGGNTQNHSVNICLNDGAGNFTIPSGYGTLRTTANPKDVVLGDVDGDGDLDFLTADYGIPNFPGTNISLRLNNGGGRFSPPPTPGNPNFFLNVGRPTGIALGDVDADGDLDIVFNTEAGANAVLLNIGNGNFTRPAANYLFASGCGLGLALADVDGDADLDLVTVSVGNRAHVDLNCTALGIPLTVRITGDSLLCGGGSVRLTAVATSSTLSYRWNTGATTASLLVTQPGTYSVTVTASGGQTRTVRRRVTALTPNVQIIGDSLLCPGTALALLGSAPNATAVLWSTGANTAGLSVSQPGIYTFTARYGSGCSVSRRVVVRAPALGIAGPTFVCQGSNVGLSAVADGATAYLWNTGATTSSISISQAGTYSVVATYRSGCTLNASTTVSQPIATISGDSVGCMAQPVTLNATQPGAATYRWNTGATTPSISVSQTGQYSVVVTYVNSCQSTARQTVRVLPGLPTFTIGADTTLCEGPTLLLRPLAGGNASGVTYRWSTGATTPTLRVQETGTYSLQLTTACDTRTASCRVQFTPCLTLPNIITPNGDRRNDRFEILGLTGEWMLQVYSRWGQRIFSTTAYHNEWGETAAAGMYYYLLQRPGGTNAYRGWLEVVR